MKKDPWEHYRTCTNGIKKESQPPRFFIDHGVIHDRVTGKHITADENFGKDTVEESLKILNELAETAISAVEK